MGEINCGCAGKPTVLACSHPNQTRPICTVHACGKPFQQIDLIDGTSIKIDSAAYRHDRQATLPTCAACQLRQPPDEVKQMPTTLQRQLSRLQQARRLDANNLLLPVRFVRWTDFESDVESLYRQLPWPISGVIGCPRSGMYAAAKIAILAGVPLWAAAKAGPPQPLGHGLRLAQAKQRRHVGPLVLIEDSTNTGTGLSSCKKHCPADVITAVCYANPHAPNKPDFAAHWLPLPHLFEWHYFGSRFAERTAFDMDGVLCQDCPTADDDDGPRYARWLRTAAPRSLPRTYEAGAIITARLEKYRTETETWLHSHGVKFRTLIMSHWESQAARRGQSLGKWKASQYEKFPGFELFLESDPQQAAEIHAATGRRTACNQTGEVWL